MGSREIEIAKNYLITNDIKEAISALLTIPALTEENIKVLNTLMTRFNRCSIDVEQSIEAKDIQMNRLTVSIYSLIDMIEYKEKKTTGKNINNNNLVEKLISEWQVKRILSENPTEIERCNSEIARLEKLLIP